MTTPTKNLVLHFEQCSLDRALEISKEYSDKLWGFSVYDLLLTEGFNAVYQLKKYGKVFADLRIDSSVDYLLQCAWSAGADIVSIKSDTTKFTDKIAAYSSCHRLYEYRVEESPFVKSVWSKTVHLQVIKVPELILFFPPTTSKIES